MLIGYLSGAFLPWRTVSWINIGYSLIPLTLTFIFVVPESPPWLISKERVEQARESLMWLAKREDESLRVSECLVGRKHNPAVNEKLNFSYLLGEDSREKTAGTVEGQGGEIIRDQRTVYLAQDEWPQATVRI